MKGVPARWLRKLFREARAGMADELKQAVQPDRLEILLEGLEGPAEIEAAIQAEFDRVLERWDRRVREEIDRMADDPGGDTVDG